MQREHNIERLQSEEFDLCIIGGGASGAGCALDAALRGLKVALIDRKDFAAETSSRSTKLIHGGVRYLERAFKNLDFAQLRQVRHGLEERHTVLKNAPHLAHPLGLVTPVFSWWEGFYFSMGLRLYDFFAAHKDNLPASRWLNKAEVLRIMPGISPRIHSAVLYYDGQLDDARYCLALIQSAAAAGAVVANHIEVVGFQKDTTGVIQKAIIQNKVVDQNSTFSIQAKQFLNCCGPYADPVRLLANKALSPRISPSKGVHLVLPLRYFNSDYAMLIPKTKDGRMVFAIPFEGNLLLGTTDDPASDLMHEPMLEATEVAFLLETLQPFVAGDIDKSDVKAGFGGLRPLVKPGKTTEQATKSLLRDHEVEFDASSGLVSLLGGKWTTYRVMAKDAIDFVCSKVGWSAPCRTETHSLAGAVGWEKDLWKKLSQTYQLDADVSQHLAGKYGVNAEQVARLAAQDDYLKQRILPHFPFIKAEVVYGAQEEMVVEISDFMARRIRLEYSEWESAKVATPEVARLLGRTLGWSEQETAARSNEYMAQITNYQKRANAPDIPSLHG